MARTRAVSIPALPDGSHRQAGRFDKGGRWYPVGEYDMPGAFGVRSPSRAWPYSYLHHYYTRAYSKRVLFAAPAVWFRVQGIDPASESAAPYVALVARHRMIGA